MLTSRSALVLILGLTVGRATLALGTEVDATTIATYQRYCETHPLELKPQIKLGALHYVRGEYDRAASRWRHVLHDANFRHSKRTKVSLARLVATAHYKDGALESSWKFIRWAYRVSPDDPKVQRLFTRVQNERHKDVQPPSPRPPEPPPPSASPEPPPPPPPPKVTMEEARTAYAEGKQQYLDGKVSLERADTVYDEQLTKAIDRFGIALTGGYKPDSSHHLLGMAHLYRGDEERGDLEAAATHLKASLNLNDQEADAWFGLAQYHGLQVQLEDELAAYEKALALDSESAEYNFHASLAWDKSDRPDAAAKTFQYAKAAIRLDAAYKKRFQEVLKNSKVASRIAGIVKEIIQGTEDETLSEEDIDGYARQIQTMLGDPDSAPDKEKMKELLNSNPEIKQKVDDMTGGDPAKLLEDPRAKKILERLQNPTR